MNKKNFILPIFAGGLLLTVISAPAMAADSGVYLAADLGQSHFSGASLESAPASWTRTESGGSGYRLTAGYQFNPYWGLEAGYVDLGHGTVTSSTKPSTDPSVVTLVSYRASVKGSFAEVTGTWPIDPQWALFARAGGIEGKLDLHLQENTVSGDVEDNTAWTPTFGVGMKWNVGSQWSLRLDWDHYHNLGNTSVEASLLSLGVEWRFF